MPLAIVYIIVIIGQVIASGTFIAGKWALAEFPPLTLAFLRFMLAATGLFVIWRLWPGRRPIERGDWKRIFLLGFLAVILNQTFFLYGLKFTTPTHAALLYSALPVFVLLFSISLRRERLTTLKIVGVLVTLAGVGVVLSQHGIDLSGTTWRGDALILVAVVAWALYTVIGKPLVAKYGAVHSTALCLMVGAIMYIPIGVFTLDAFDPGAISARGWWSLLYIAFGTSVVAYTIWFWALGRLEATKLSVFNNLSPVITAGLSFWLIGEMVGVRLIAGGLLVIFGVVLTERG